MSGFDGKNCVLYILYSKHLGQRTAKVDAFSPPLDRLNFLASTRYPNQYQGVKEGTKISKNSAVIALMEAVQFSSVQSLSRVQLFATP